MNYTVGEISEITSSSLVGDQNLSVKHIAFDTRKIFSAENTAFIAINTSKNSGEKYIQQAINKGIKVIIAEKKLELDEEITWILVENAVRFLQNFAKFHLSNNPALQTIGITGSNGKTIVKEWLFQTLNDDFSVVKSPKSYNSQIGLPLSILQILPENEVGIFEVGISKPGEMEIQENVFSPKIGVLTHIGSAHSANFENQEELIREKLKLFQHSETIIFNGDHQLTTKIISDVYSDKRLVSYGFDSSNDVKITNDWQNKSNEVEIQLNNEVFNINIQQRDQATLSNALCIITLLHEFNFSKEKIIDKINALKAVEMRLESIEGVRNNLIINDSFNLDLDSLIIAYQFISEYNKEKKSLVLTDFLEGKDNTEVFYKKVADLTNAKKFNSIFLVGNEITKFQGFFEGEIFTFYNTNELSENQEFNEIKDSIILLKGARKFELENLKNNLELQKHDTILEVHLNSILHNINVHRSFLKPETKMMAMVKAFSYGMGGYEIAEFLQHHHIDYLGVAYADEGIDLRKKGITTPIMVMNPEQHSYSGIIDFHLEPEIYSLRVLDLFHEQLKSKDTDEAYPIHIKIETGMHRLGFKEDEIDELIKKLKTMDVVVKSIFSHLSSSDIPEEKGYTLQQIEIFKKISNKLKKALKESPILHILNSSGITNYPEYQFDMVRIGIGMIGITSNKELKKQMQSAVSFKTVISQIHEAEANDTIGYSRNYVVPNKTRIATLPVGYADGIPRLIGNKKGKVAIQNQLVPIVGNICMDMLMVDIGDLRAKEGDEVTIFNSNPTLEEFAGYCNTISYEVLTSISRRVKRIYIKN